MAHNKPQAIPIESQQAGHELRDTPVAPILIGAVAIFALLIMSIMAVIVLLGYFNTNLEKEYAANAGVPQIETIQVVPAMHLQVNPERDLMIKKSHDQHILETYGWVNKNADKVHIPIDVAMEKALEEGFPVTVKQ